MLNAQIALNFFEPEEHLLNVIHEQVNIGNQKEKILIGEFWTNKQRQASSIHEVSYRACFKPQLPNYFITKYTNENDVVYDPFGGRGTTAIEAALLKRRVIQNDINPLSNIFSKSRLYPPTYDEVRERLNKIKVNSTLECDIDLSMFFHAETLIEILSLKDYFHQKELNSSNDFVDDWIRMVATNRLTGHSTGFFSVYTMPPNQAVSAKRQVAINKQRNQIPEYRDTKKLILKKTKQLLSSLSESDKKSLRLAHSTSRYFNNPANNTPTIENDSVSLVVTSPPFMDVVQYKDDNWLRCWFNNIDSEQIGKNITMSKTASEWAIEMKSVLEELYRVLKVNGFVAFEVGEVRNGKIKLDEIIVPLGKRWAFLVSLL